ncbi:MAG: methyl-accepting chemotaxis protein [Candidatus Adiutrix sp.]|jgi:methyl-accepting chemotaxis protein|nr:methyl-accepting chemotaxis protein [Candidatus Adiutrix sp.]
MKLGTKIIMGFVLTNVIFLILVAVVFVYMQPVKNNSNVMVGATLPILDISTDLQSNMALAMAEIRAYVASPDNDPAILEKAHQNIRGIQQNIPDIDKVLSAPLSESVRIPEVVNNFNAIKKDFETFKVMADQVAELQDTILKTRNRVVEMQKNVEKSLTDLVEVQNKYLATEQNSGDADAVSRRMKRIEVMFSARDEFEAGFLMYTRGLLRQDTALFRKAVDLTNESAKILNDLKGSSKYQETITSIDQLTSAIAAYLDSLNTVIVKTDENARTTKERGDIIYAIVNNSGALAKAARDLAVQTGQETIGSVSSVIWTISMGVLVAVIISLGLAIAITRSITIPVHRIITTLSEGAQEVDNASGELSSASNTLAEGATENAASLEETSAALEELSSMTSRNSDNAVEANALMSQATEAVAKAEGSMANVIKAMSEIATSGNEIGKIIKTIDEIAFQTNLLALNAAVEAARAGEAGAGFAVVADEVRNLAIRSADAAKNTADLIAATISNINSGSEMVTSTAENFETVATHSAKVAHLISEVAEASKEQSQGISQITTAMNQMDKVTQSNAAAAEESASAAGQLSLQAGNLMTAVEDMTTMVQGRGAALGRSAPKAVAPPRKPLVIPPPKRKGASSGSATANKALPMDDDDFGL